MCCVSREEEGIKKYIYVYTCFFLTEMYIPHIHTPCTSLLPLHYYYCPPLSTLSAASGVCVCGGGVSPAIGRVESWGEFHHHHAGWLSGCSLSLSLSLSGPLSCYSPTTDGMLATYTHSQTPSETDTKKTLDKTIRQYYFLSTIRKKEIIYRTCFPIVVLYFFFSKQVERKNINPPYDWKRI